MIEYNNWLNTKIYLFNYIVKSKKEPVSISALILDSCLFYAHFLFLNALI